MAALVVLDVIHNIRDVQAATGGVGGELCLTVLGDKLV